MDNQENKSKKEQKPYKKPDNYIIKTVSEMEGKLPLANWRKRIKE